MHPGCSRALVDQKESKLVSYSVSVAQITRFSKHTLIRLIRASPALEASTRGVY